MKIIIVLFISCLSFSVSAGVDHVSDKERIALEKVIVYLRDANRLIELAEHSKSNNTRFPLNYEALLDDVRNIHDALSRHLKAPSRSPRAITPLNNNYEHREGASAASNEIIGVFVE